MGSDLYMEERNWRARPNYAEWEGDNLLIYQDAFYHGYGVIWKGRVTESNKSLILKFVKNIPDKPKRVPSKQEQVEILLYEWSENDGLGYDKNDLVVLAEQIMFVVNRPEDK